MMYVLFLAVLVTLVQLSGAYLRYLPFRRDMSAADVHLLWQRFLGWSIVGTCLGAAVFTVFGAETIPYKRLLFFGWIPYFFLSMTVIRHRTSEHVFVLGMQCLWAVSLHAIVAIIESQFLDPSMPPAVPLHTVFYLILLVCLLPWERRLFSELMPSPGVFTHRNYRISFVSLPFVIFVGTLLVLADRQFAGDMRLKLSMLLIPIFFFLMYRSLGIFTQQREGKRKEEQAIRLMKQQMETLQESENLQNDWEERTLRHRKELYQDYEQLYGLIDSGKLTEALNCLQKRERQPYAPDIRLFCQSTLVNSALSIYLGRAEQAGIRVHQKVNLPPNFATKESDFAVLLSNLLENALHASQEQPKGEGEISLVIKHSGDRCVLELANRYPAPLDLGENGLPASKEAGHGLGMTSLLSFAEKYDAYVDFSQENGWVTVLMYWEDKAGQ